jgi:hypothetical protein
MAKQYMPLKDGSEAAVLGGEIPQLRPLVFSDDSKYTTFSYTYYPEGLEISDSYTYDPGGSEISETVAREIATFDVLPTNYPGGLEISGSYIYYPGDQKFPKLLPGKSLRSALPRQIIQGDWKFPKLLFPILALVSMRSKQLLISPKLKGTYKVF